MGFAGMPIWCIASAYVGSVGEQGLKSTRKRVYMRFLRMGVTSCNRSPLIRRFLSLNGWMVEGEVLSKVWMKSKGLAWLLQDVDGPFDSFVFISRRLDIQYV